MRSATSAIAVTCLPVLFLSACLPRDGNEEVRSPNPGGKPLPAGELSTAPTNPIELPDPLAPGDFVAADRTQVELGRLLFYDKILSGNRNISCGTCHHHDLDGTDRLSLGIGEGGAGLGPERTAGTGADRIRQRIPRNSPALWNLGHRTIEALFHDGRLSVSGSHVSGFVSPAGEWLPQGLDHIVAAQALFPVSSEHEMAGNEAENEVTAAFRERVDAGWPFLADRVRRIPAYGEMFAIAFDHVETPDDVTIVEIGNAIGAFIVSEWRNFDSPFDRYLAGDGTALGAAEVRGMELFFGDAGCSVCHAGPLLSDQGFHALGLPAFGPGRSNEPDAVPRDIGRMAETDRPEDAYGFRTPMLRNVALSAPYGHNGAYPTLEGIVRHHLDPVVARAAWRPASTNLPPAPWLADTDFTAMENGDELARQEAAINIALPPRTDGEVADLVAFLNALTGETAGTRPLGRPETVPSGLPVD